MDKPDGGLGRNLYKLLEIDPGASPQVVTAAYKALSVKYAPRAANDDQRKTQDLNIARDILIDPTKREGYDFYLRNRASRTIGHYVIESELPAGGHCEVYKATHEITEKPVVIKHCRGLSSENRAILIEEARILSDIRHFAIPKFRDIFTLNDGSIVLVEDYIPGPTLSELVTACGQLNAETVCWITGRILQILKYLHYNGVVHGDIKPENIVLWPDEHQAFLIDFGIAAFMPIPGSKNRGWVEVYSPPEQQPPDRKRLVPQNDFYSLGMTMLFMINKDMNLVRDKKIPKSLPEPVLQFIRRMIRANPDDRPNWANEDIEATLLEVRQQAFNQTRSGFASIPDWRDKLAYSSR